MVHIKITMTRLLKEIEKNRDEKAKTLLPNIKINK